MAEKLSSSKSLPPQSDRGEYVVGAAILIAALMISGMIYLSASGVQKSVEAVKITYYGSGSNAASAAGGVASAELKSKVEAFLDTNFLASQGLSAEVTKIEPYGSHLYAASVNVKSGDSVLQGTTIYVSLDGKDMVLGGQAFKANETVKKETGTAQAQEAPKANKTDKPAAKAFIMSYCPYGLQMLKAYVPVIELLGSKADLDVGFVAYAMHGKKEIDGNNYIYCVQKESRPKLAAYLRCFVESGNYTSCLATAGVDVAKTEACTSALDTQYNITGLYNDKSTWLSQAYPVYPVESAENKEYGVQGSPTFVLNGVQVSTSRSADALKKAICGAFKAAPAECSTALSSTEEAPGLGKIGSGAAPAGSTTAGCGG